MKLQAQCFCIKVIPFSVKPETHIITLPAPDSFVETEREDFEDEEAKEQQAAYDFLLKALADFLPPHLELEESSCMYGDNEGFFFSCSDADSDSRYYLILRYTSL